MNEKNKVIAMVARRGWWILLVVVLLPGCADIKNVLSFPRIGPDEFTVVTGKPLLLPPDFTLRPPAHGAADASRRAQEAAQEALFSEGSSGDGSGDDMTTGEAALLEQLGSSQALQEIADAGGEEDEAMIVDPEAEAERLRANEEAGVAPTEGATPTRTEPGKSIFSDFWNFF